MSFLRRTLQGARALALTVGLGAVAVAGSAALGNQAHAFELKGPPKIAFIYAASIKDGGWNEAIDASRKQVEKDLGVKIATSESIPEEATAFRAAVDLYVKRGFNIIVGTSYGYSGPIAEAAKAYPDVAFLNASGTTNGANLESFYARTYQAWYLAGMAAGAVTTSGKIGILAGFPVSVVNWDVDAFIRGARAMKPDTQVIAVYTNSWWDPVKEGQTAEAMLDQNADVIATNLSAASALNAAEKKGKYAIGYQIDMTSYAPKGILTSVVFKWENYLTPTLKAIIGGTWKPEEYGAFVPLSTHTVDLVPFSANISAEAKAKIEAARAAIEAGKLTPFDGPVTKQDGTVAIPAGQSMTDDQLWALDYFVEGAIGTMPPAPKE
ncbi:BMP family ABC transporter substrate-binding protein [Zavarzinia sp.]|uniref:BMP family ABC transporter substrate-binding protein n=1 Tax=Zavarzinia sp. TaxID=2027920 RepID=UPI0035667549